MGDKSKIDWTDATWSPVTGCTKVSAGCKNCYAEGIARRFWGERKFTDVRCHPERLDIPLKWKKPRKIFVNSMSDLFHDGVPDTFIDSVFDICRETPQHTYQVLTKRPGRMFDYFSQVPVCRNVWLGISAENQDTYDLRHHHLLSLYPPVRFVSIEPMLDSIDLCLRYHTENQFDWVIVGGESGPGYRPMDPDWARSIRDQCRKAGVPFFMKQMAGKKPIPKDLQIREWPQADLIEKAGES